MKWWERALDGEYVGEKRKRNKREKRKERERLSTPGYGAFHSSPGREK